MERPARRNSCVGLSLIAAMTRPPNVMKVQGPWFKPGVAAALGAALLFGAGTPLAKLLLRDV
jgi:hypothetical protein